MRAAQSRAWQPASIDLPQAITTTVPPYKGIYRSPARRQAQKSGGSLGYGALFAAAFLLGYLPGIVAGRSTADQGSVLAAYYMDKQNFSEWKPVFIDLYAGAFLQATLILLLGTCALGMLLLAAFFALKGMYLGYCAAGIFAQQGARGLVTHWLLTCLPDLSILLLLFSLTLCAIPLCRALLHIAYGTAGHSTSYSGLYAYSKALVMRYLLVLALAAVFCALGAGSAVFFAGILL